MGGKKKTNKPNQNRNKQQEKNPKTKANHKIGTKNLGERGRRREGGERGVKAKPKQSEESSEETEMASASRKLSDLEGRPRSSQISIENKS